MEILGLAIVVALILMAAIFVVKFVVLKAPTDYRKGFTGSQLASNILNTFLKTNAEECKGLTMTELLQDCAQSEAVCCLNCENSDSDDDVNSCQYAKLTAIGIFDKTLKVWHNNYEFAAYKDPIRPLISLGTKCAADKKSKLYPIPIQAGTMYIRLDICG